MHSESSQIWHPSIIVLMDIIIKVWDELSKTIIFDVFEKKVKILWIQMYRRRLSSDHQTLPWIIIKLPLCPVSMVNIPVNNQNSTISMVWQFKNFTPLYRNYRPLKILYFSWHWFRIKHFLTNLSIILHFVVFYNNVHCCFYVNIYDFIFFRIVHYHANPK